jgi:hypothetical protein
MARIVWIFLQLIIRQKIVSAMVEILKLIFWVKSGIVKKSIIKIQKTPL